MFSRENITDALRFWEIARIGYNLILVGIVAALFIPFLNDYGPAAWTYLLTPQILVLAILANVAYSTIYPIDLFIQASDFRSSRVIWRAGLFAVGVSLAGVLTWFAMASVIGMALF